MLQYLNSEEQKHFAGLQKKLAQLLISDAEQSELRALVNKAQQLASARGQALETVRRLIAENALTVLEVFSDDAVRKAKSGRTPGPEQSAVSGPRAKAAKTNRRNEQVLIQVKLDKSAGAPSRYKLGQKLGKVVSRNFKQLDQSGQLVENLLKYATPLGKSHFSTEAGQAELEKFAAFVRKTPVAN